MSANLTTTRDRRDDNLTPLRELAQSPPVRFLSIDAGERPAARRELQPFEPWLLPRSVRPGGGAREGGAKKR